MWWRRRSEALWNWGRLGREVKTWGASGKGKNRVKELEVSTNLKISLPGSKGKKERKGWSETRGWDFRRVLGGCGRGHGYGSVWLWQHGGEHWSWGGQEPRGQGAARLPAWTLKPPGFAKDLRWPGRRWVICQSLSSRRAGKWPISRWQQK